MLPAALLVLVTGCSAGAPFAAPQESDPATTSTQPIAEASYADTVRPTWQANGRVESIVMSAEAIYLGGEFTDMAPPGSAAWVSRPHVAAIDITSGAPLSWTPEVNGRVRSIDMSDDGQTLYIGGDFTEVDGERRDGLAALDATSGSLIADFAPEVDGKVRSVLAGSDRLFVGGTLSGVNGQTHSLIAALDPSTGDPVPNWSPRIEYPTHPDIANVIAMAVSTDGATLYVGGTFRSVDDENRNGAATIRGVRRPSRPVEPPAVESAEDLETQVYDIALDGDHVYLCGDYHLTDGVFTPNLVAVDTEGVRRSDWEVTTDGGVNSCEISGGHIYLGGHFDRVGGPNADPKLNPTPTGETRNHLASVDLATGDVTGWDPTANSITGVFAVAVGVEDIAIGGDFDRVGADAAAQQSFAVFETNKT